ncbi:MAG: hypothetical protein LBW85_05075, partial [Deltaproteobacteria bacterium]|nr:hypothetical protein [Deltaproteobacteria bacterium]
MADQLLTYIILPPGQAGLQDDPGGGVQGAGPPFSPEADWALLSGMLSRELPREAALTLAEPRAGPGGTLGWHTPLEGIPRELSALKGREREEAERALGERASQFAALGARLASAPSPESKAAARLLSRLSAALAAAAAGLPGREIVYVVGKSPVVACWARPPEPEPQAAPPPPPPVPEPEPYPGPYEEAPAAPPLAYAAPPAAAAPEAAAGPGLLRMAGAALLAFLFLVFLFFLLAPGFRRAASAISGEDPAAGLDPGLEDGLRRELASLRERYEETLTACRPEETGPLIEDDPPELPEPDAQILMPPSSGDAEGGVEAAQPPPPPPPPPAGKPPAGPNAQPQKK